MDALLLLPDKINDEMTRLVFAQALVMMRFWGFFSLSPFFSRFAMTRMVRTGVIMAVSLLATPAIYAALPDPMPSTWSYLLFMAKELALGLLLGTLTWLPVRGLQIAGVIVDTQRGATQGQSLDPIFAEQGTETSVLFAQVFSGYFFATGGFLAVLNTLYRSFTLWPAAEVLPSLTQQDATLFIHMAGSIFLSAVIIIAPISGFMLLADIAISFLARAAPSLNALTLGMPVKSGILIIMLMFYISIIFPQLMQQLYTALEMIMRAFGQ